MRIILCPSLRIIARLLPGVLVYWCTVSPPALLSVDITGLIYPFALAVVHPAVRVTVLAWSLIMRCFLWWLHGV